MAKHYDPDAGQFDCEPTILTATYRGREYRGEGVGDYDDEWPERGAPHPDAFNSAWESIAQQLPDGNFGDEVDLTSDGLFSAGRLEWLGDNWSYRP